jgi:predicted MFS family arabinose efflux permease
VGRLAADDARQGQGARLVPLGRGRRAGRGGGGGLRVLPDLGADRQAPGGRPALFKRRNFWAGTLALSVAYGLFFGNVVLLPLWLQQYMGYTATEAGMVLAPVGLLAMVLSPVVGKTVAKVDPRRYATFAFMVFALVLWMRSNFNTQADFAPS